MGTLIDEERTKQPTSENPEKPSDTLGKKKSKKKTSTQKTGKSGGGKPGKGGLCRERESKKKPALFAQKLRHPLKKRKIKGDANTHMTDAPIKATSLRP